MNENEQPKNFSSLNILPASIIVAGMIISGALVYQSRDSSTITLSQTEQTGMVSMEQIVPSGGFVLPVTWGNMGAQLVEAGAIDAPRFRSLYEQRGEFSAESERLLSGDNSAKLVITSENSGFLLNLFWALGLASKNPILEKGEMADSRYGGAQNFASTGGWNMAVGHPMSHYSKHAFFDLSGEEQDMVARVAKGIFRPCCNNSTHFPDCNHGMAMLGLLQLMASQGADEDEMYKTALAVNSFWYPDTYATIATYLHQRGVTWNNANAKDVLGSRFSSGSGYAQIVAEVSNPPQRGGGGGCSV